MSHKKFGPDRFSRFDVYWIQRNKQTNKQTDRQAKFIYRYIRAKSFIDIKEFNFCHKLRLSYNLATRFPRPLLFQIINSGR